MRVLESGGNPRNGSAIINAVKGTSYKSAMGYLVYIDENGDAAGNYTILSRKFIKIRDQKRYGLIPVGTFSAPNIEQMPVSGILKFNFLIINLTSFCSLFLLLCSYLIFYTMLS